jgi:hypothetical protein
VYDDRMTYMVTLCFCTVALNVFWLIGVRHTSSDGRVPCRSVAGVVSLLFELLIVTQASKL